MGAFEDMLEDFDLQAVFLEFQLEDWPALARLTPEEKGHLFVGVETEFKRLEGSVQAINVVRDQLHLVAQTSPDHSIQEYIDALEEITIRTAADREDYQWRGDMYVESVTPTSVIDSVVRIQGASR
jgi:hypothetical protein